MKKASFLLLALLLFLSSCATERIYSFSSTEGMRVFLRPVELKGEYPVSLDLSIPSEKSRLSGDAILNYSVEGKKGSVRFMEELSLTFVSNGDKVEPLSPELLFVEGSGKDNFSVRFTSILKEEDVGKIMEGEVEAYVTVDGIDYPLDATAFNRSLSDLSSFFI